MGFVGYAALGVLLGLLALVALGVDLQEMMLETITSWFGIDVTFWFVPRWMGLSSLALWSPQYSLLTGGVLTVGVFVFCPGARLRVYLLLWAMALVWPTLTMELRAWPIRLGYPLGIRAVFMQMVVANVPLLVLAALSHSVRVWICAVVAHGLQAGALFGPDLMLYEDVRWGTVFWIDLWWIAYHLLIVLTVFAWARTHWTAWDDESLCSACGYEVAGLPDQSVCPECGEPIVPEV